MNNPRFLLLTLLFAVAAQIYAQQTYQTVVRTDIKGRLLTVDEGCGYSKVANTRIVGGGPAKDGAWPWLVLLVKRSWTNIYGCGGSLITSKHILTAGHCVHGPDFARLGAYDIESDTDGKYEDVDIAERFQHQQFNAGLHLNDIGVLKLIKDITFNDRISPICLPDSGEILTRSFVDQNPFVAGWGKQSESAYVKNANILQQVQVPVISNAECKEKYKKIGRLDNDTQFSDIVLCAGFTEGGKDSCLYDSGGPLMLPEHENGKFPYYQIGVVSWGVGCARPNVPGVYVNVRHYMDWIKEKLLL